VVLGGVNNQSSSDSSGVFGGKSNEVSSAHTNSVILGGNGLTSVKSNTAHVDELNINTASESTSTKVLVRDGDGMVKTSDYRNFSQQKYADDLAFTGGTSQTITHNLSDTDVLVQLKDSTGELITPDAVNNYTNNTVDIEVSSTETYRVIIIG
jgi:hypothetical protein